MARSPGSFKRWIATILLFWALAPAWLGYAQDGRSEREVKALFFVTLTRYIEWPTNAFTSDKTPITLGIIGTDPFGNILEKLTQNEEVRGRRLRIERFDTADEVKECHLLFFAQGSAFRQELELAKLARRPIVTVSDTDAFSKRGGMIEMFLNPEKKIRLKISKSVTDRTGVKISQALERVAEPVASTGYQPRFPHLWISTAHTRPSLMDGPLIQMAHVPQ